MRALQSHSDCCVHNLYDQMNLIFQVSLIRSSGQLLDYDAESPRVKSQLGQWNSFKKYKFLFLIEDISELEC